MVKRLPWFQILPSYMVRRIVYVGVSIASGGMLVSGGMAVSRERVVNGDTANGDTVNGERVESIATRPLSSRAYPQSSPPVSSSSPLVSTIRLNSDRLVALADTVLGERDRPLLQFGSEGEAVQAVQALLQLMGYYSGQIDGRYQESTLAAVSSFQQAAGLSVDGIVGPTTWEKLLPQPEAVETVESSISDDPVTLSNSNVEGIDGDSSTGGSTNTSAEGEGNVGGGIDQPPSDVTHTPNAGGGGDVVTEQPSPASAETSASTPSTNTSDEVTLPTLRRGMRGPAVINLQERLRGMGLLDGVVDGVFGEQTEDAVKAAQRSFSLNSDGVVGPATWAALLQ